MNFQKTKQFISQGAICIFGILCLVIFVLGIVLDASTNFSELGLCISSGCVGLISCILGFFGLKLNDSSSLYLNKKIVKFFIILFFVTQIVISFLLYLGGILLLMLKTMVDTLVKYNLPEYGNLVSVGKGVSLLSGVGVLSIIIVVFIFVVVVLTVIYVGFEFFAKVLITTVSGIYGVIGLIIGIALMITVTWILGIFPLALLAASSILGFVVVFKKNRGNKGCLSCCYVSLIIIIAFIFLILVIVLGSLRSLLHSFIADMCNINDKDCEDFMKSVWDVSCEGLEGSELQQCEEIYNIDTAIGFYGKAMNTLLNFLISFFLYFFFASVVVVIIAIIFTRREPLVQMEMNAAALTGPPQSYEVEPGMYRSYSRGAGDGAGGYPDSVDYKQQQVQAYPSPAQGYQPHPSSSYPQQDYHQSAPAEYQQPPPQTYPSQPIYQQPSPSSSLPPQYPQAYLQDKNDENRSLIRNEEGLDE